MRINSLLAFITSVSIFGLMRNWGRRVLPLAIAMLLGIMIASPFAQFNFTQSASAQVAPAVGTYNGSIQTTCTLAAVARICSIPIPAATSACAITLNTIVTLSGLTATVQVASDGNAANTAATTWTVDPYFNNGSITAAGTYSGTVIFPPYSFAPTNISINVTALTSGSAAVIVTCTSNPYALGVGPIYPSGTGAWNAAEPVGAGNVVISNHAGFLISAVITTTGTTTNNTCYDNATTNSGTIIAVIPGTTANASALTGYYLLLNKPVLNGITCAGSASGPAVTFSFF